MNCCPARSETWLGYGAIRQYITTMERPAATERASGSIAVTRVEAGDRLNGSSPLLASLRRRSWRSISRPKRRLYG